MRVFPPDSVALKQSRRRGGRWAHLDAFSASSDCHHFLGNLTFPARGLRMIYRWSCCRLFRGLRAYLFIYSFTEPAAWASKLPGPGLRLSRGRGAVRCAQSGAPSAGPGPGSAPRHKGRGTKCSGVGGHRRPGQRNLCLPIAALAFPPAPGAGKLHAYRN